MVLLDFSITPLGKGESVSRYVARCLEVVAASGSLAFPAPRRTIQLISGALLSFKSAPINH
jgi:uncharacterized protein YqgV (UPF0045/DUF77 family)